MAQRRETKENKEQPETTGILSEAKIVEELKT